MSLRKGTAYGQEGEPCPRSRCSGHLVAWDCGCSWGCETCWVSFECDKCHKKIAHQALAKPKANCPYCGQEKYEQGMGAHVKAKHPDRLLEFWTSRKA